MVDPVPLPTPEQMDAAKAELERALEEPRCLDRLRRVRERTTRRFAQEDMNGSGNGTSNPGEAPA